MTSIMIPTVIIEILRSTNIKFVRSFFISFENHWHQQLILPIVRARLLQKNTNTVFHWRQNLSHTIFIATSSFKIEIRIAHNNISDYFANILDMVSHFDSFITFAQKGDKKDRCTYLLIEINGLSLPITEKSR